MGTSGIAKRKGLYMATRPNLEQLKKQAREFLNTLVQGDSQARERLFDVHPKYRDRAAQGPQRPVLADAQLLLAREHGFPSWPRLKRFVDDLERVDREAEELRQAWLRGDEATREKVRLAKRPHFVGDRFENPGPDDELTSHDAHAVVAMEKGYAGWGKYESFLHLDPNVRDVIAAIRVGDLDRVRKILAEDPNASQSRWAGDYRPSHLGRERGENKSGFEPGPDARVANDSIPLFVVSEALFCGTNKRRNEYELAKALLAAGADPMIENHLPMTSACSFNDLGSVKALLEAGADVDGPGGHGVNLCYALFFGFTELSEFLGAQGAKVDLRFAAGLGWLKKVRSFLNTDGSLKPGAGSLADPYRVEPDRPHNAPRTRDLVLQQALMFACLHDRLEVATFLMDQGASPSAIVTGLDVNCTVMHSLSQVATGATMEKQEVEERRLPAVRLLLEYGYDLKVRDVQHDATALMWAEHAGAQRIATLLRARNQQGA